MNDRVWEIESSGQSLSPSREKSSQEAPGPQRLRRPPPKNPAWAFSLSLLLWGSGQAYNRQWKLGLLFPLLMANWALFSYTVFAHWPSLLVLLKPWQVTISQFLLGFTAFFCLGLVFWICNARQAYLKAVRTRTEPFEGLEKPALAALGSLLLPGWGQFLNGQPKKGVCFLALTAVGFSAAALSLLITLQWPVLKAGAGGAFWEKVLAGLLASVPFFILMDVISVHDALKVSLDPYKREPLRKRFKYALNRVRIKGFGGTLIPRMELNLLLILTLAFLLTVSYSYFPKAYYLHSLSNLQVQLEKKEMTFIPRMLSQILKTDAA